jgi:predicted membrane-bound spermidine synthase
MRALFVSLAFFISLAVTAAVVFFAVLILAGPHGGLLPVSFHAGVLVIGVLVIGWLVVFGVPLLVPRWVWRRQAHRRK